MFKSIDWQAVMPFIIALPMFSIGFVFLLIRIAEIRESRASMRALAERRRALEHGDRGWDCPRPGPFHYIPDGETKGGRRVR